MLNWLIIASFMVILDVGCKCYSLTCLKICVFVLWTGRHTTCVMLCLKPWQLLSKWTDWHRACVMSCLNPCQLISKGTDWHMTYVMPCLKVCQHITHIFLILYVLQINHNMQELCCTWLFLDIHAWNDHGLRLHS